MPHAMMLITTGGTIAGQVAKEQEGSVSAAQSVRAVDAVARDAAGFKEMMQPTIDYLEERLKATISIMPKPVCNVDSSDMDPKRWVDIIKLIAANYEKFNSFVITHGTNTLGYTCAALSFAIANSRKPIILTGSQVPAGLPGTDAMTNLQNAVRLAVMDRSKARRPLPISGVMAVFGSHIITGTRVKKDTEFDYDAFKSFGGSSLGRIGRIININDSNMDKHVGYLSTSEYNITDRIDDLKVDFRFEPNIVSITEFPGMDPGIFETLVRQREVKGFILRAFGAGDPAKSLRPAFKFLRDHEIPIVVTTQAPNGNSNFLVNEPGMWLKKNKMAIPAWDMGIEAQTTKLMWLLAKKAARELSYDNLCELMTNDLRGEINILWEVGL